MASGLSTMPTPIYSIQQHSRFTRQDGWQLYDISLCSSGNMAVSGYDYDGRTFVCIYSTVDNSDSRDKPTLLYEKEFEEYSGYWYYRSRPISFIKPNSTEIVTCVGDNVTVLDYNRDVVLRSRKVNGETTCLSVSESQIFIGLVLSDIVNIYDIDLNRIKSIKIKEMREDLPIDISAVADRLYVCTVDGRAIVYSQTNGSILTEYTTVQDYSKACSITVNVQLSLAVVLWNWNQIIFYLLSENKSFLTVNVEYGVSRIRISDQGRIVTGNGGTGEVKIYDLFSNFITYDTVKQTWINMLRKADCERLTDYFCLPKDQTDSILKSVTPIRNLLLALEERGTIYPSNMSSLIEAFVTLQMSETYYWAANIYQEKARATSYDRFLVTLSAHLTSSLPGDLCDYFKISDEKKNSITSDKNPGLSLLLALDEMGILNQSSVGALKQPFTNLKLVQAVAKIQEYQSVVEDEKDSYQHTMSLTEEGTRNIFVKLLKKKIKSWYETMTPVPWKKSCRWKSSELFVGSSLILTNSKTRRSVADVDEQCKLQYTDIFSHDSLKEETRIIIEGEPGSGKTMLSSQLAYDWSEGKITDVNIFILLPLKLVETKTLLEATKDFYQTEGKGLSLTDIEDVIRVEGEKCCFLLDGLEEYNGKNDTSTEEPSEVMKVMKKAKYPNCKVIITSRSDFAKDLPSSPMLKLGGFSEEHRDGYIEKVFSDDYEKQMEVKKIIEDTPFILDLCTVPLLFVLAVHNIEGMESVLDIQQERVAPFIGKMVVTLCPPLQRKDKVRGRERYYDDYESLLYEEDCDDSEDDDLESNQNKPQRISLEMLAFNGLCKGKQQLSWQKRFIEENVRDGKQYLDSGILVVEEAVNLGKEVDRTALATLVREEDDTALSEVTEKTYTMWNNFEKATESGRVVITKREVSEEAKQESQKDKVDSVIVEKETRAVKQTSDVSGIVEHNDESSKIESTVNAETQSTEDLKSSLTLQHVSLQVKFLHKIIQEWFAARHLANICWKYGELSLCQRYDFLREHLQQINPADLHYVLRFTCALCPPSCHFILNYLVSAFHSKEGVIPDYIMNCICLCLAEYDGYKGHYIKDAISEVCKADITIHSEDSRLLQGSKVSMLKFASKCKLPISRLLLPDVIVGATEDELNFKSGATLKILNTLQRIEMSGWDHTLREDDYTNIIKFIINSAAVEKAFLHFPHEPPTMEEKVVQDQATRAHVEWIIGPRLIKTLHRETGGWILKGTAQDTILQTQTKQKGSKTADCIADDSGSDITRLEESQLQDFHQLLQAEKIITKSGGSLEIPNTGVALTVPPNALPEDKEQCTVQMRIIPHRMEEDEASFSNSSVVVELLPDNLRLQRHVRLSLPHCLVLRQVPKRKARIFISHHVKGSPPQWEEHTYLSYHLEDTTCIILLDSFCEVKYSVDDEIVTAKKIIVYAAAKKLLPQHNVATTTVGYYSDLPGKGSKFLLDNPDLIVSQKKTFIFRKSEKCCPLQLSLERIFPDSWQCSENNGLQQVPYETVASISKEKSFYYVLHTEGKVTGNPLCIFTASQEKGQLPIHLGVCPQTKRKDYLPAIDMDIHLSQFQASLKTKATISHIGGTLQIPDTEVSLEIPSDALPANKEPCLIQMRIIPRRIAHQDEVTSFSSNSCVAVEILSDDLQLQKPMKLTLPHCLEFRENVDENAVSIFTNSIKEESHTDWKEQTDLEYCLDESACIIWMDKPCCVKYSVKDDIVIGKNIVVYTAARKDIQNNEITEVEVGYYPDMPGGGELLDLNPNLVVDCRKILSFKENQKSPLQLSRDSIVPPGWTCRFLEKNPQKIPFTMIACSIEHSYLYVLQKTDEKAGFPVCKFTATQANVDDTTELTVDACLQDDHPKGAVQKEQRQINADPMTVTFQLLTKKLTGEWNSLGIKLGLNDADLFRIKEDFKRTEEIIYQMLQFWKKNKGSAATYAVLITALKGVGRTDLAENVQNLKDIIGEA